MNYQKEGCCPHRPIILLHLEPPPPLPPHPASANLEAGPTAWCPGGSPPLGPTQAMVLLLEDEG